MTIRLKGNERSSCLPARRSPERRSAQSAGSRRPEARQIGQRPAELSVEREGGGVGTALEHAEPHEVRIERDLADDELPTRPQHAAKLAERRRLPWGEAPRTCGP